MGRPFDSYIFKFKMNKVKHSYDNKDYYVVGNGSPDHNRVWWNGVNGWACSTNFCAHEIKNYIKTGDWIIQNDKGELEK